MAFKVCPETLPQVHGFQGMPRNPTTSSWLSRYAPKPYHKFMAKVLIDEIRHSVFIGKTQFIEGYKQKWPISFY